MPLAMHHDERGIFTELFRREWPIDIVPVQWNFAASNANVLRGVHVHPIHSDYLIVLSGVMILGLCDLSQNSPTYRQSIVITLSGEKLQSVLIPNGVAHGFYFPVPTQHIYAVSTYWNLEDELGCRWDDPDLEIPWPTIKPSISARDVNLPTYNDLIEQLSSWQTHWLFTV